MAQIGSEHIFTNADINNWIKKEIVVESNEEQMELTDTKSYNLYDNGHEQQKITVDYRITSTNLYGVTEYNGLWNMISRQQH